MDIEEEPWTIEIIDRFALSDVTVRRLEIDYTEVNK